VLSVAQALVGDGAHALSPSRALPFGRPASTLGRAAA